MIRKTLVGFIMAMVMVTSSLPAFAGTTESVPETVPDATLESIAAELEMILEPVYQAHQAAIEMPDGHQFLPPLTKEHGVNRAKDVLADAMTPLALAAALQAQTSGTADASVHEIDALALNVFAYYATVGYDEDPEFGAVAKDRLQKAVALFVASDGDVQKYFPDARTDPPTEEEVKAFVDGMMNVQVDGVEVLAPQGQELGRDITIYENDFLRTVDMLLEQYRETQRVNVDVLDARWSDSYSWFYYSGSYYGGYFYSGEYLYHRYVNVYYGGERYDLYDYYRMTYDKHLTVSEFESMLSTRDQRDLFNRVEQVRGLASVPFVASAASDAGNPEANLLGTVALPFAFADSWWMQVLRFDYDQSMSQRASFDYEYGGTYDYYHYYSYRYYRVEQTYYHVYHRHWYYTCGWWSCYWTYWWHYHGYQYGGANTYTYSAGSGASHYAGSYNYNYGYDYSNRQSTSVHSSMIMNERFIVDMPGIVVAPEGKITFTVPAKQYSLLARESTAHDAVDARTGLDTGASAVPFEGLGALPTQRETTRYDEQCERTFVIAPVPNDCALLADEDTTTTGADASGEEAAAEAAMLGAESTLVDAIADPEGFVNGAVPAVPAVPEPEVPEPTVPEPPAFVLPEAPDAEAVVADALVTLQSAATGVLADAQAVADDPEGFVADAVDDARATTVETPGQSVDAVTVADDETFEVTFEVAEFSSGAVYVASIGLVAKDGLTAIDPEDILVTVTGKGVAGESPDLEYSTDTPCYESQITGDGGSGLFPAVPDTTPGDCVRESDEGESAVFRLVHRIDLDGDELVTGVDATSTNVGATADAGEAAATDAVDAASGEVPDADPENPPEPPEDAPEVPDPGLPEPPE